MKSKSIELSDYKAQEAGTRAIRHAIASCVGQEIPIYFPHPHRLWEYGGAMQAYLETFGSFRGGLQALDIGCGNSPLGPALELTTDTTVTEIDPDIRLLAKRKGTARRSFEVGDLLALDGRGPYDAVFCISVIEHIEEQVEAWNSLIQLVKPGGLLFVTTDFGEDHTKPWYADTERVAKYDPKRVANMGEWLTERGFTLDLDPTFYGPQVFDYTFFRWVAHATK